MPALLLLLALQTAAPSPAPLPDEITVVAHARKCDLQLGKHFLSKAELNAKAAEWAAGRPVRVMVPAEASAKCLAKVMFRLADHGVGNAEFVDR